MSNLRGEPTLRRGDVVVQSGDPDQPMSFWIVLRTRSLASHGRPEALQHLCIHVETGKMGQFLDSDVRFVDRAPVLNRNR
jgi:hypothetical protein